MVHRDRGVRNAGKKKMVMMKMVGMTTKPNPNQPPPQPPLHQSNHHQNPLDIPNVPSAHYPKVRLKPRMRAAVMMTITTAKIITMTVTVPYHHNQQFNPGPHRVVVTVPDVLNIAAQPILTVPNSQDMAGTGNMVGMVIYPHSRRHHCSLPPPPTPPPHSDQALPTLVMVNTKT